MSKTEFSHVTKVSLYFVFVWVVGLFFGIFLNKIHFLPREFVPLVGFVATIVLLVQIFRQGSNAVYMVQGRRVQIENRVAEVQGVALFCPNKKLRNIDTQDEEDIMESSVWSDMVSSSESALIIRN